MHNKDKMEKNRVRKMINSMKKTMDRREKSNNRMAMEMKKKNIIRMTIKEH